jgi:hypothetical protein
MKGVITMKKFFKAGISLHSNFLQVTRLNIIHKTPVMVEVFKTNVENKNQAEQILKELKKSFPGLKINFDLDDCDKILRVEGTNIPSCAIVELMKSNKFLCEILQ